MYMAMGNWGQAYNEFYEGFRNYQEAGNPNAKVSRVLDLHRLCLLTLVLSIACACLVYCVRSFSCALLHSPWRIRAMSRSHAGGGLAMSLVPGSNLGRPRNGKIIRCKECGARNDDQEGPTRWPVESEDHSFFLVLMGSQYYCS